MTEAKPRFPTCARHVPDTFPARNFHLLFALPTIFVPFFGPKKKGENFKKMSLWEVFLPLGCRFPFLTHLTGLLPSPRAFKIDLGQSGLLTPLAGTLIEVETTLLGNLTCFFNRSHEICHHLHDQENHFSTPPKPACAPLTAALSGNGLATLHLPPAH